MPAAGTRSTKGSWGLGTCRCTASITSCVACGPVTASTLGCTCCTRLPPASPFLAPRQPVTMTLPFSARASPMVSRLSLTASSMKPQVLTITRSAPAKVLEVSYPSARSCVRMSSESVSALGQPRETKPILGAEPAEVGTNGLASASCVIRRFSPDASPQLAFRCGEAWHAREQGLGLLGHLLLHLRKHGLGLLEVVAHQVLHRWCLPVEKLRPH